LNDHAKGSERDQDRCRFDLCEENGNRAELKPSENDRREISPLIKDNQELQGRRNSTGTHKEGNRRNAPV